MGFDIVKKRKGIHISDGHNNDWFFSNESTSIYHNGDYVKLREGDIILDMRHDLVDTPSVSTGAELFDLLHDHINGVTDSVTMPNTISLNATTSTTLISANANRIGLIISDTHNSQGFYIKFQSASVDNDKKGIFLGAGRTFELPQDLLYKGEVSAIANSEAVDVTVIEW